MDEEVAFLQAMRAAPQDDALRLVYADWLEERGDHRAEYLRTQLSLDSMRPRNPRRAVLKHRLRELRKGMDIAWLTTVDRPEIENCSLEFSFQCPKYWASLQPTEKATIRWCDTCEQRVYYCNTVDEALSLALRGECVAIDTSLVRKPGDVIRHRPSSSRDLPRMT